MEQGTVNALASLVGLVGGKVAEDFQQVQQAKLQRMQGLGQLASFIKQNPDYAKDPMVAQQLQSIANQPQATTGELFKKMFFGQTPEMVNMDLGMLNQQVGMLDNARLANIANTTYGVKDFRGQDISNLEALKALSTLGVPSQMTKNIEDANKQAVSNWAIRNTPSIYKQAMNVGSKGGNLSYIEDVPMGTDPNLIATPYSLAFRESQQTGRTKLQQQGAKERTAMAQEGANKRMQMTTATSRENNQRSTGAQLSLGQQRLAQQAKYEASRLSQAERNAKLNALSKLLVRTPEQETLFQELLNTKPIPTITTPPPKPQGVVPSKQRQSVLGAKTQGMDAEFFRALQKG